MNKNIRILRLIIVLEVFLLIILAAMAVVKGCRMPYNDYLTTQEETQVSDTERGTFNGFTVKNVGGTLFTV